MWNFQADISSWVTNVVCVLKTLKTDFFYFRERFKISLVPSILSNPSTKFNSESTLLSFLWRNRRAAAVKMFYRNSRKIFTDWGCKANVWTGEPAQIVNMHEWDIQPHRTHPHRYWARPSQTSWWDSFESEVVLTFICPGRYTRRAGNSLVLKYLCSCVLSIDFRFSLSHLGEVYIKK